MNIFEVYKRIDEIHNEFDTQVNDFIQYHNKNSNKKNEAYIAMANAGMKYFSRHPSIDPNDNTFNEAVREVILEARKLPSYNVCNVLVWMKRYKRIEREYAQKYYQYLQAIEKANRKIRELKEIITPKFKIKETLLERLDALDLDIMTEKYNLIEWERDDEDTVIMLRGLNLGISKNDMLSIFSLNHEGWEKEYIDQLPDTIDAKTFEKATFAYKLEDDQDSIFFDIFFDDMVRVIDGNKEVKEKVFDTFREVFGPIQTYTAYTDESGNVARMEPNQPKLTVISNENK